MKPLPQLTMDLIRARDYMREHGWCQHTARNDQGQRCITGSLIGSTDVKGRQRAYAFLGGMLGSITFWNDTPGRTYEEVEAMWDRAISLSMEDAH